jgi:hypothetical protein
VLLLGVLSGRSGSQQRLCMAPLPTTSAPFRHKRWLRAALLAAVLVAALVVLFRVLLGDTGGGPSPLANVDPDSGNPLHVAIRVPSAGARLPSADPSVVFVQSFAGGVVVRFELWVDGKLTRYQLSPESDPTLPASGRLQWLPDAPGPHVLLARALDAEGRMGRSRPVVVEAAADPNEGLVPVTVNLQPGNTVESIDQALGTTPDMVRWANPSSAGAIGRGRGKRHPRRRWRVGSWRPRRDSRSAIPTAPGAFQVGVKRMQAHSAHRRRSRRSSCPGGRTAAKARILPNA